MNFYRVMLKISVTVWKGVKSGPELLISIIPCDKMTVLGDCN